MNIRLVQQLDTSRKHGSWICTLECSFTLHDSLTSSELESARPLREESVGIPLLLDALQLLVVGVVEEQARRLVVHAVVHEERCDLRSASVLLFRADGIGVVALDVSDNVVREVVRVAVRMLLIQGVDPRDIVLHLQNDVSM